MARSLWLRGHEGPALRELQEETVGGGTGHPCLYVSQRLESERHIEADGEGVSNVYTMTGVRPQWSIFH